MNVTPAACTTATSPINISMSSIDGPCVLKCDYNYDYDYGIITITIIIVIVIIINLQPSALNSHPSSPRLQPSDSRP